MHGEDSGHATAIDDGHWTRGPLNKKKAGTRFRGQRPRTAARGVAAYPGASAHGGRIVGLVHRGPLCKGDVVGVDHHRVGHGEGLTVHDDAHGRIEERHPLLGDKAHARVLGHPGALHVELLDDRLGVRLLVHLGGTGGSAVEAIGHPLGNLVAGSHLGLHPRDQAVLVKGNHVPALPELEGVLRVQEQLIRGTTVGAHLHGHLRDDRGARVMHAQHQQLRRLRCMRGDGVGHRRGRRHRHVGSGSQHPAFFLRGQARAGEAGSGARNM